MATEPLHGDAQSTSKPSDNRENSSSKRAFIPELLPKDILDKAQKDLRATDRSGTDTQAPRSGNRTAQESDIRGTAAISNTAEVSDDDYDDDDWYTTRARPKLLPPSATSQAQTRMAMVLGSLVVQSLLDEDEEMAD